MDLNITRFIPLLIQIIIFGFVWWLITQIKFWLPLRLQLNEWEKVRIKGKNNFVRRFLMVGFPYITAMLVLNRGDILRNENGLKDALLILTIACFSFVVTYYIARGVWNAYEKEYSKSSSQSGN